MHRYVVYAPGGARNVETAFAHRHAIVPDTLWVVAADVATCVDVCQKLGMLAADGPYGGVVFSINDYFGRFDTALWEKLDAWKPTAR